MREDRQPKANIDRMDGRKMNGLRRVNGLPDRGGPNDWVICCETIDGVDYDVTYAWVDGRWTRLASVEAE